MPADRERIPFEPGRKRNAETSTEPSAAATGNAIRAASRAEADLSATPKAVTRRMVRRMLAFCGIPTVLGLVSLFAFYGIANYTTLELPHTAAVLVSMGLFGMGVLGLSYGIISTSWEENAPGSLLGWPEFRANAARLAQAWRAARRERQQADRS